MPISMPACHLVAGLASRCQGQPPNWGVPNVPNSGGEQPNHAGTTEHAPAFKVHRLSTHTPYCSHAVLRCLPLSHSAASGGGARAGDAAQHAAGGHRARSGGAGGCHRGRPLAAHGGAQGAVAACVEAVERRQLWAAALWERSLGEPCGSSTLFACGAFPRWRCLVCWGSSGGRHGCGCVISCMLRDSNVVSCRTAARCTASVPTAWSEFPVCSAAVCI